MRTYKDAKAMARSLRDSLAARRVPLSHSECLEIVAKQFGCIDWNTHAAKICVVPVHLAHPESPQNTLQSDLPDEVNHKSRIAAPKHLVSCAFCGKSEHEVPRFIEGRCSRQSRVAAGPRAHGSCVFVCEECVTFCAQVIADNGWERQIDANIMAAPL